MMRMSEQQLRPVQDILNNSST